MTGTMSEYPDLQMGGLSLLPSAMQLMKGTLSGTKRSDKLTMHNKTLNLLPCSQVDINLCSGAYQL